jgi:hypothetical protein
MVFDNRLYRMPKEKLLGELLCLDYTKIFSNQQPNISIAAFVPLQ